MNKIIATTLLFISFTSELPAQTSHFFKKRKQLTIPQRECERKEGIKIAHQEASLFSGLCAFFIGGLTTTLSLAASEQKNEKETTIKSILGGILTGIITYHLMYDKQEKNALDRYYNYAPMNDELQEILYDASSYNYNLLNIAQKVANINLFIQEIAIESANKNFPILKTYKDFEAMLDYLESAEIKFENILYKHEALSASAQKALRDFIDEAQNTQRIIKKIMATIKVTPFYTTELEEKRKMKLYKAKLNRINAETDLASEKIRRQRAERERAQQETHLAAAKTAQKWADVFYPKTKNDEIHVHI